MHENDVINQRNTLHADMQAILDGASNENRELSAEEAQRYDALEADFDKRSTELDRLRRQNQRTAALRSIEVPASARAAGENAETRNTPKNGTPEYRAAFGNWLRNSETRDDSAMLERRAMGIGTNTAGGFLVPTGFHTEIVEVMKTFGTVLNTATVLRTASGAPLPVPTMDDTGNEGAIVAENAAIPSQDAALGSATLGAYKFTSKMINVSYELLQDAAAVTLSDAPGSGIENLIRDIAGERIGRIMDHKFIQGTGTGEPQGLATAVVTGVTGATGQTTSIIYDNLIDLIHSVDKSYRNAARFVANDLTIAAIRKLKDTQGHPLWQPSVQAGVADTLLGYAVDTNNYVATMAANAKSLYFGDLRKYYVRMVDEVIAMRLVERYADLGQVAFFILMRADGHLMDTTAIKAYANSAT